MGAVRRTADGIEISRSVVQLLLSTGALLIMLGGFGAAAWRKADRIDKAVQIGEFGDTTRSIRTSLASVSSSVAGVSQRVDQMSADLLGLQCMQANYPSPFCDRVTRHAGPQQAGQPRRPR